MGINSTTSISTQESDGLREGKPTRYYKSPASLRSSVVFKQRRKIFRQPFITNRRDKARNTVSHSSSRRSRWTCKSGCVGHTSYKEEPCLLPLITCFFTSLPFCLQSASLCCSFAPLLLCFLSCFQTSIDRSIDQSWYGVIRILNHPWILHKYFHEVIDPWMDQWFNVQWIHRSWSDRSMNE